ncbi:MAG: hypothetical protein HYY40_13400 [Bacteroidetes bacterium]|nr:hypothetical protein [Bacteroidota bacterium]
MNILKFILTSFCIGCALSLLRAQFITHHNSVPQTGLSLQPVNSPFTDPQFNTAVIRISDARNDGLPGIFPDYSKRQAWNCDESKMMLRTASGEVMIYDGTTYQYIKTLPGNLTGIQDIFWHPTDPLTVFFIADNTINTMNIQTEQITLLRTFSNYFYVTTRAEGNMSNDAHYIALAGYDSNWLLTDFFVYDILIDSVVGTINAGTFVQDFDWISISPLGNYVVVDYANEITGQFNGVEVYDRQFNFIWQKPLGAGHSDLGLDSDGTEVLIMDIYDADSNMTFFKKFHLSDGSETVLLGISPLFDQHESCRNMDRPGWVYISTFDYVGRLTDDSASWLPFEDEVFALKMNGSGTVQRIAHHHSRRYSPLTPNSDSSVYFSEPHATVNNNGTRILFGSNWRENMEQDTSVDAYIVDISNMLTSDKKSEMMPVKKTSVFISINIVGNTICEIPSGILSLCKLELYDISGKRVYASGLKHALRTGFPDNLKNRLYLYRIFDTAGFIVTGKILF